MAGRKDWSGRDRETIAGWISAIDELLKRYFDETKEGDLKATEFLKLADMDQMIAEEGEKKVVVRWVTCEEKRPEGDETEQ